MVKHLLAASYEKALGLLYPEVCQFCREESAGYLESYLCARCWQRFRFVRHPFCDVCGLPFDGEMLSSFECSNCRDDRFVFRGARSALVANDFSLDLIHRYKYGGAVWLEQLLAGLLWDQLSILGLTDGWDFIVPVPLYPTKQREREFNQAERIGRFLGKRLRVPVLSDLVKRVAPTETQTMLSRSERRHNVRGAFAVGRKRSLSRLRVMLVDDVFTTGATTNACARVLRKMGAREIWVCTVVRGL